MSRASVALASVLALGPGACKHPEIESSNAQPVPVHCVAPKADVVDETVALRGRLEPPPGGNVPVAPQVSGRVVSLSVHEGQRVQSGDVIATLEDAPSRDALRQAEASLAQTQAADMNSQTTLERTRALVARGIAAKQELEDAVARAEAAKAGVKAAEAAAHFAQRTLGRVQVRSSFAGVVTRIWRGPGTLVDGTAATPIVQLAAENGVELVADVSPAELAAIREGQPATGTLIGGAALEGSVRARASALDTITGLGTVRVALVAVPPGVPLGSYGRIVVTTAHRDAKIVVPAAALRGAVADGAELVVCRDGKAEIRAVKVGWRDDHLVEVLEGLGATEAVAVDHVLGLDNGTPLVEAK